MSETTIKLTAEQRQEIIITTGVDLANLNGLITATHRRVADACSVPTSFHTVKYHFRTRGDLWAAIARHDRAAKHVKEQARRLGVL